MSLILAIETSCDETAAAVVREGTLVLSNVVASQHELHERYRGVVPEIASRAHLEKMMPVIIDALSEAAGKDGAADWRAMLQRVNAIAVGNRPGLIGSLLVGVSAAKALAWSLAIPIVGVDHIQAHLYAAAMHDHGTPAVAPPVYPALGLVVSGGHTSMYEVDSPLSMKLIGRTIDDAVGEAYDKAAVILGVPYPGGPLLDKLAQQGNAKAAGEPLPRSLLEHGNLDFSFSGLKTSLLYRVRGHPVGRGPEAKFERSERDLTDAQRRDFAAAFQDAAVDAVILKLGRALSDMAKRKKPARSLVIGGGVSANSLMRQRVAELGAKRGLAVCLPKMAYCVDNAAMIGGLAHHAIAAGQLDDLELPAIATTSM